jgi:chemotaxis protein methyltransferase CheR
MDKDFISLKKEILKKTSLDCNQYKDTYLIRRFAVRMRARGVSNYVEYIALLSSDPAEYDELMKDLTINVTQFFRDISVFKAIEENVFPQMIYDKINENRPILRVWSAGCSSGEEAYSIAIILRELLGEEFDNFAITIVGTDIDEECLHQASEGVYLARQLVNVPKPYLEKYFVKVGELYQLSSEITSMAHFRNLDLFSGTAGSNFDCIFCRNVVIYFTREQQEKLFMKFYRSLTDGGYFVMGNTETLTGDSSKKFSTVLSRERIYQRNGHE